MKRKQWTRIFLAGGGVALFAGGISIGVLASVDRNDDSSEDPSGALVATTDGSSSSDVTPVPTDDDDEAAAAPAAILIDQPTPAPEGFIETFEDPSSLDLFDFEVHHRSDHDPEVDYPASPNQKLGANTWPGDHGLDCGPPDETRTLAAADRPSLFYWCREHIMTSMGDVDGYSTIAFSPKQAFRTVSEVCWDQNVTDLGGRQWTEVVLTPVSAMTTRDGDGHIAHTNPGTETHVDETAALHVPETVGVRIHTGYDGLTVWHQRELVFVDNYYFNDEEGFGSRAIRREHCLTDLGDGTLEIRINRGASGDYVAEIEGSFPVDARVIFEDHNYTPDKDGEARDHYTWHWDNIVITP